MSIDAAQLARRMRSIFPRRIRERGDDYHREGRVKIEELAEGYAVTIVQGESDYFVELSWDETTDGHVSCECMSFDRDGVCKHVWASVLAIAERAGRNAKDGAAHPGEDPWRQRLADLRRHGRTGRRDPWGSLVSGDFEIRYVIDIGATVERGALALRTMVRKRRRDGEWGIPKPYKPQSRTAEPPYDALDRRILAGLRGAVREQGATSYYSPRTYATNEFTLDADVRDELLPLLAKTGRLDRGTRDGVEPIEWDDGPPWFLRIGMRSQADRGFTIVEAWLEREGERMDVGEPDLMLEDGLLLAHGKLGRLEPGEAFDQAAELRLRGPIVAPIESEEEVRGELREISGDALALDADAVIVSPRRPIPILTVSSPGKHSPHRRGTHGGGLLDCAIRFDYGDLLVAPSDPRSAVPRASDGAIVRRDLTGEHELLTQFLSAGGRAEPVDELNGAEVDRDGTVFATRLVALVGELLEAGWLVEADARIWRKAGSMKVSVRSGQDWFDLEGGLAFGDEVVSLPRLLAAARHGDRTVKLGDGSIGVLPEDWLAEWGITEFAGEVEGDALRFRSQQAWLLDALLAEREGVVVDAGFDAYREKLAGFAGIAPEDAPPTFVGELRTYQREGLGWFRFLRELGLGGCLADDMGLGKTIQTLALLAARKLERRAGEPRTSLIVAPRSLVFNWIDEAERFTPSLAVTDYTGTDRKAKLASLDLADVVVTTYGTMRNDILELKDMHFDYVVLDEAQAIKNQTSLSAKASRLLHAEQRLALSGTPIENHLGELWSLFEFLNPGMLGRSRAFQRLVSKHGKVGAEDNDLSAIARAVRPFFLRRRKEEVLDDLPEKTEQTLHCELSARERKEYDELRDHYRAALLGAADPGDAQAAADFSKMKIQVLEALLRLRQAACHPALIDASRSGESSSKLDTLLPLLEEVVDEGNKALVFSQFTSFLAILRQRLDEKGIPYEYLDGSTRDRKTPVERFQRRDDCPLFLISIKAGGHGLNLTAADYVFLMDPWWNPAVEAQAIDRAHRIGRRRPVTAYRLLAKGTVEEKVVALQADKRELAESILGASGGALRDLTREDLAQLLS